jgi:hypothetical protein
MMASPVKAETCSCMSRCLIQIYLYFDCILILFSYTHTTRMILLKADHLSRGVLPTVMRRWVWSRKPREWGGPGLPGVVAPKIKIKDWYSQQRLGNITDSIFMVVQKQYVFLDCPEDRGRTSSEEPVTSYKSAWRRIAVGLNFICDRRNLPFLCTNAIFVRINTDLRQLSASRVSALLCQQTRKICGVRRKLYLLNVRNYGCWIIICGRCVYDVTVRLSTSH